MNNLKSLDKIERIIMKVGKLTVKQVILVGSKGAGDKKLPSIYLKEYNSKKYSDTTKGATLTINPNDYLVFEYNDFEAKINESIFISYPNIQFLEMFLEDTCNMIFAEGVYTDNAVSLQYKDTFVKSAELSQGKSLVSMPCKIEKQDQQFVDGVVLFINSDSNWVEVDNSTFYAIARIITRMDFYTNANIILNAAVEIMSGSSGHSNNPLSGGVQNNSGMQQRTSPAGTNLNLFGNKNQRSNYQQNRTGGSNFSNFQRNNQNTTIPNNQPHVQQSDNTENVSPNIPQEPIDSEGMENFLNGQINDNNSVLDFEKIISGADEVDMDQEIEF